MGVFAGTPAGRPLVVRHAELADLRATLAEAALGLPRFVLVEGEAGMGRTTLLDQFVAGIDGASLLRGSGEEFETSLNYGVVAQLCRSFGGELPGALIAVSDATNATEEPFTVGAALLEVVDALQERAPVVVVVDDAHLADAPSQLALLFALRRLDRLRVMAVLSAPVDRASLVVRGLQKLVAGVAGTTLRLPGLGDAGVRELGVALGARPLSCALVERLREHTGGNPLHIRQLLEDPGVEALDRAGDWPLPTPRPHGLVVKGRLAVCTWQARRLVGAIAVVGRECEFGLARRLAAVEEPLAALEVAVAAGLVEYGERRVRFRSALDRSAVYYALGIGERAELHGRAASLVDDRASRLRHLAAAATEEDGELAAAMSAFAEAALRRGARAGAAGLFVDAAGLVPAGAIKERLMLDAVECHLSGGDVAASTPLTRGLEASQHGGRAHYLLGRLARLHGRPEDAERLLRRAEELCPVAAEPQLEAKVAAELAGLHVHLLEPAQAARRAEAALRSPGQTAIAGRTLPCLALSLALTGRATEGLEIVAALADPEENQATDASGVLLARSVLHQYAGDSRQAHDDAARLVRMCGARHEPLLHTCGLAMLAFTEYRMGAWEDAVAHARLGLSTASDADLALVTSTLHAAAVWPLAGLGRWDAAEGHATSAEAAARGPWDLAMASIARAVLACGRGRHAEALDAIAVLRTLGAPGVVDEPDGFWSWQGLYVDASLTTGRIDDAAAVLERFEALAGERGSALGGASASRLRGVLEMARGNQRDAEAAFRRSLALSSTLAGSFERAVTQAAYGAFLRRAGKRSAAVAELGSAHDAFERLGAEPWLEMCERETAASGLTPRKRRRPEDTELTPQESSVARLVAQGRSNRAVASELVVSVNTVEYHLKNIFAKLGISSRTQLVLRLAVPPADVCDRRPERTVPGS